MSSSFQFILYAGELSDSSGNGPTPDQSFKDLLDLSFPQLTTTALSARKGQLDCQTAFLRVEGCVDCLNSAIEAVRSKWSETSSASHLLVVSVFKQDSGALPQGALNCKKDASYSWWRPPDFEIDQFKPDPASFRCNPPFEFEIGVRVPNQTTRLPLDWVAFHNIRIAEATAKLRLVKLKSETASNSSQPTKEAGNLVQQIKGLKKRKSDCLRAGVLVRLNKLILSEMFASLEREIADSDSLDHWRAERDRWIAKCYDAENEFNHESLQLELDSAALDAEVEVRNLHLSRWAMYLAIASCTGVVMGYFDRCYTLILETLMGRLGQMEPGSLVIGVMNLVVAIVAGAILLLICRDGLAVLTHDSMASGWLNRLLRRRTGD